MEHFSVKLSIEKYLYLFRVLIYVYSTVLNCHISYFAIRIVYRQTCKVRFVVYLYKIVTILLKNELSYNS